MRAFLVPMLGVAAACDGGGSVWSSSVTQLVLHSSGGFVAPYQPTADCPINGVEYTLVVAGRSLSAWRCERGPTAPYPLVRTTASRGLAPAEYNALVPTLEALRVISVDTCGADKPEVIVTVTERSRTIEYGDSFYSCNDDHRPTIDTNALDAAAAAFRQLAFP